MITNGIKSNYLKRSAYLTSHNKYYPPFSSTLSYKPPFKLLPERLRHFESFIPSLKEAQDEIRRRGRHRRGSSSIGVGVDCSSPTPPTGSKTSFL